VVFEHKEDIDVQLQLVLQEQAAGQGPESLVHHHRQVVAQQHTLLE